MTTYSTMYVGGGTNPTTYAETATADFTGSKFNVEASGNYVRLTQYAVGFTGSEFATSGTDFDGTFYSTEKSGGGIINSTSPGSANILSYDGSKDNSNNYGGNDRIAQAIKATFTGSVVGVECYCSQGNSYSAAGSMFQVGIATNISGAFIAFGWFNGADLNTFAGGQIYEYLAFTTKAPLTSGTTYYIRWETSGQLGHATDQWRWTIDTTSPAYADGAYWSSTDSGAWAENTGVDLNWKLWQESGGTYATTGSYLHTFSINGSYWNIGSINWQATSGANELVAVQYRTAGSNAAFSAWSSYSTANAVVINGSNIGSVQMIFLTSGPTTSTPILDQFNLDYNLVGSYATNGSYLITKDLSGLGGGGERHQMQGIIWNSGGVGPISVDYRFSNDGSSWTGYSGNSTGSFALPTNTFYRYVQLRFNLSGTGTAE